MIAVALQTEALSRDQVAAFFLLAFMLAVLLLFAAMQIAERLGWLRPMHGSVKRSDQLDDRSVEPHPAHLGENAARTSAGAVRGGAPHQDAGARGAGGAGVRARTEENDGSLVLTAAEQQAVSRMVRHKIAIPDSKKLDTIQAGWPEIKARSGDPQSKYARASAIYDSVFAPPETTPIAERQVPPGVEFAR